MNKIYFIREGEKLPVKVGKTQDVEKRLSSLQAGNSSELKLVATIEDFGETEKLIHEYLKSKDKHIHGEWFTLTDDDISDTINYCKSAPSIKHSGETAEKNQKSINNFSLSQRESILYSSSKMAEKLGVSVETLRNWDRSGKLTAQRSPTNRMLYSYEQYLTAIGCDQSKKIGNGLDAVKGKNVLITGGTGTLGNALTERICECARKVIIYSRDELKQSNMREKFAGYDNIRFLIGDVRDKNRLLMALKDVNVCIHAAALKRIEVCTYDSEEAIKSNILGSMNVVEACIENNVKQSLLVSTDKACMPITMYGASKLVSEQLFINSNNYSNRSSTLFSVVRYGNVFNSRGSVASLFKEQAKEGKIKITHKEMSRFFMSLENSVDLVLYALNNSTVGGEIFVPKLKAIKMTRFAEIFCPDVPIEIIGFRGYEKIDEQLISDFEILHTVDQGKYYKIMPPYIGEKNVGWSLDYPDEPKVGVFEYSSDKTEQFSDEEMRDLDK